LADSAENKETEKEKAQEEEGESPCSPLPIASNQPYLNLATFRMVVLADEILESFFETDLSASFRLDPVTELELPAPNSGLLGDFWSTIATDNNKKMFNLFTDEIGKTIGKHQVVHRPSIGRYKSLEEPKARESLLTPGMRHSTSKPILRDSSSSSSSLSVNVPPTPSAKEPASAIGYSPMVQAANAALLARPAFTIDDSKDDDEETEDDLETGDNDDQVMDEVDAFLEAHDSGLTDADKEVAKDLINAEPVK